MVFRIAGVGLFVCLLIVAQSERPTLKPESQAQSANQDGTDAEAPAPLTCPAGGPIGAVDLRVRSPQQGAQPLPLRTINHVTEGDTILYSPILRGREKRHGEVALVMTPQKRGPNEKEALIVTDPKPADKPQEWKVDRTTSIVAYVYGPEGLSKKKVRGFLAQDEVLVAQLADYAEKTAQTEALLEALSNTDSSSASVNAALTGFASQYGVSVQIDKNAPPAVQAQTLFSAMNPQLATFDPLASSGTAKISQTVGLTATAASLFFGSPIGGLAAGGTAMLLDLRAIAFPGTQFRSSFAQATPDGINLCGQRNPAPPHTRVAYIWANRIPNTPAPSIQVGAASYIPQRQKTPVPVDVPERQWKYLERARNWTLDAGGKKTAVQVLKLANQRALELDVSKSSVPAGEYHLAGFWDWTRFEAKGSIFVRPLSDFNNAKLEASSQDRLLAKSGKVAVTLEGDDFEFASKVELKKVGDEFATAQSTPFVLPKGLRQGPQSHMDVQIDAAQLDPGEYELLISQQDGTAHPVRVKVLPNPPQITNLPVLANEGVTKQHFVLKGQRLGLLTKLQTPGAVLQLEGETAADQSQRSVTVQLSSNPKPGTTYPISAYIEDRNEPLVFPDGLKITGPLPVIASSKLSLPTGVAVSLLPGEFPAGSTLTAMLDVKNIEPQSVLQLECGGDASPRTVLHIGEQTEKWSLQQLSPDQLFVSYDTSSLPAGCLVEGVIDNGSDGRSQPYTLARMVRLPQIEQLASTNEAGTDGKHNYTLTGRNLEMIEKLGWDQLTGFEAADLPAPIPGQGQRQTLRVALPDPSTPTANLFVWLRGEKTGRATTVAYTRPVPPQPAPPPPPAPAAAPPAASPTNEGNSTPDAAQRTKAATPKPPEQPQNPSK
ncbi:MAG: hypothetical protein JOZ62_09280 [Acidobacteriaceae bacterium]|nr:hypothetical protein [Acidobacteriaceae bacterium]